MRGTTGNPQSNGGRGYFLDLVLRILFIMCNCFQNVVNRTDTRERRWCEAARSFGSKCLHNLSKHQKANDLNISDQICLRGISRQKYPSSRWPVMLMELEWPGASEEKKWESVRTDLDMVFGRLKGW